MPVAFLTDEQAAAYGAFGEVPTRPELERFLFLDDDDRDLSHFPEHWPWAEAFTALHAATGPPAA